MELPILESHHLLGSISFAKNNAIISPKAANYGSHRFLTLISVAKNNPIIAAASSPQPGSRRLLLLVVLLTDSSPTIKISHVLELHHRHIRGSKLDVCPLQMELVTPRLGFI
jgi:hypothetical protein